MRELDQRIAEITGWEDFQTREEDGELIGREPYGMRKFRPVPYFSGNLNVLATAINLMTPEFRGVMREEIVARVEAGITDNTKPPAMVAAEIFVSVFERL